MKRPKEPRERPSTDTSTSTTTFEEERRLRQFRDRLRDGKVRALRHGVRGEPQPGVLKLLSDQTTLAWLPRPSRWARALAWPSILCALLWSWTSLLLRACWCWCRWLACRCFSSVYFTVRGRQSGFDGTYDQYRTQSYQETDEAWREMTVVALTDVRSVRDGRQTTNFLRTLKYVAPELLPENDDRCLSLCASSMDVLALSPSPASTPSFATSSSNSADGGKNGDGDEVVDDVSLTDTERLVVGGSSSSSIMSSVAMNAASTSTTAERTLDLEFEDAATRNVACSFFVRAAHLAGTIDLCEPQDVPVPRSASIACFQVLSHPSFELLILAVVGTAMLHIALRPFVNEDIEEGEDGNGSDAMSPLEWALLALLTAEQVAKIVALEGVGPMLRKPWDAFDLVVVALSWLALAASAATSASSWAVARALAGVDMLPLRVFRCLRALKSWRGFREVLDTFLASLPMAGNALLCYCYYLFLFSILGMYLFNDSLSHRCSVDLGATTGGATEWVAAFPNRFCKLTSGSTSSLIDGMALVDATACGGTHACVAMSAPNNGNTGFHSFQASFLTAYLVTLRAGFGSALDGALQASSYLSIAYFIALVVFVSYTILALFVGIVRGAYISVGILGGAREREHEAQMAAYLAKRRPRIPSATDKFPDVAQVALKWWRTWRERVRDAVLRSPLFQSRDDPDDSFLASFRLRQHRVFFVLEPGGAALDRIATVCESLLFEHFMNGVVLVNAVLFSLEYHGMSSRYAARLHAIETALIVVYAAELVLVCANAGDLRSYLRSYLRSPWNRLDFLILLAAGAEYVSMAVSLVLYTDMTTRVVRVPALPARAPVPRRAQQERAHAGAGRAAGQRAGAAERHGLLPGAHERVRRAGHAPVRRQVPRGHALALRHVRRRHADALQGRVRRQSLADLPRVARGRAGVRARHHGLLPGLLCARRAPVAQHPGRRAAAQLRHERGRAQEDAERAVPGAHARHAARAPL